MANRGIGNRACAFLGCMILASAAAHSATVPTEKLPFFLVPKLTKAPAIDGTIDAEEWKGAVAASGVVEQGSNVLHPRPTTYYLAWDEGHIYLACRTWVMPGYKPRVGGRRPQSASVGDDGLELHWLPTGKNVSAGRTDSSYKFFINCLGHTGTYNRVSVGQLFMNWVPRFRSAARLTKPGSAPQGGQWWEMEFAATTEDFELDGPNRAGDEWKMMLGFNHMPMWMQARLPSNSGYFDPSGYCRVRLAEEAPAVQVRMEDLPGLCDGVAAATVDVTNPTGKPMTLKATAAYTEFQTKTEGKKKTTEEVELLTKTHDLAVAAGATASWKIAEELPRDLGKNQGGVLYRVTQGEEEVFRYYAYFKTSYPERFMAWSPPQAAFPLQLTFNPTASNLLVSGDAYYLEKPDAAQSLQLTVKRQADQAVIYEGRLEEPDHHRFTRLLQLPPLQEGEYEAEASLILADGSQVGPEKKVFQKLDEAKAFSAWWQKGLGAVERVLPPFEAVKREGRRIRMFGRSYELGALGLPVSIQSRGAEVMAAPARIVVIRNGEEAVVPLEGEPQITEAKPWRVSFAGKAAGAGLAFESRGWIEQDGLCWLEITYAPAAGKAIELEALRIEYPVRADVAEGMLCIGPGGNYSARTVKRLPEEQGSLWSTLSIGRLGSGMAVGSFFPEVWLGSEQRGLLWWGDSDRGWVPDDEVPAHEIVRRNEAVVLVNHIIGKPFSLAEKRTLALSYNATPFRPLVKNWRRVSHSTNGTFTGGPEWGGIGYKQRKDPETGQVVDGWDWIAPPSKDPAEWSAIWAQYKEKADAKVKKEKPFDPSQARNWMFVHTSLASVGYGWKSPEQKVTGYFGPAWGDKENYTESNIDYYLYLFDRAIREGGLRTVYWDIFFPHPHQNAQNGIGYFLPDGRVQPGYAGWNRRRFHQRVHALFHDHGLVPGAQVCHATNAYQLVAMPWMSALLDGEYHKLTNESTMDWVDGYSVERMQFMSCPHTWGVGVSWMNHIHIGNKEKKARVTRGFLDYCRLFDSWAGASLGKPSDTLLDWGLLDADYVPFWRNNLVTCKDKDILISLWRLEDRVIVNVFNHDKEKTQSPVLAIDLKRLGLLPTLEWQEWVDVRSLEKDETIKAPALDFYGQTVTVNGIKPRTARLFGVRRY